MVREVKAGVVVECLGSLSRDKLEERVLGMRYHHSLLYVFHISFLFPNQFLISLDISFSSAIQERYVDSA